MNQFVDCELHLDILHRLLELLRLVFDECLLVNLNLAFLTKLSISLLLQKNIIRSFILEILKLLVSFGSLSFLPSTSLLFVLFSLCDEVFYVGLMTIRVLQKLIFLTFNISNMFVGSEKLFLHNGCPLIDITVLVLRVVTHVRGTLQLLYVLRLLVKVLLNPISMRLKSVNWCCVSHFYL